VNEFFRQVGEYINQTYYAGKAFVLTKKEKKVAALVPMALLNRLTELGTFHDQTTENQRQAGLAGIEVMQTSETATR